MLRRGFDAVLGRMTPLSQQKCWYLFDGFHAQDNSDPAAASVSQPLALLAWLYAHQANKLAASGARHGELIPQLSDG